MLPALVALLLAAPVAAQEQARVPPAWCAPGAVFADAFEAGARWQPSPSGGSGGAAPGAHTRLVSVFGNPRSYYLYVPAQAAVPGAAPILIALHGAAGPGNAPAAAAGTRDDWAAAAERGGFVVAAPIASGAQGGWVPANDFAYLEAVRADLAAAYGIDRNREYLWGFSAGGHVAHGIALPNAYRYAAYAVSAGVLDAYAGAGAPAAAARRVPLLSLIGTVDPLYPYADLDRTRFVAAGWTEDDTLRFAPFAGGHVYTQDQLDAAWAFLCRWALPP